MSDPEPDRPATPPTGPETAQPGAPPGSNAPAEAPAPRARTPILHHPLLYGALGVWVLLTGWLLAPCAVKESPSLPASHAHGLIESVFGPEKELDLRGALVVLPPLIIGCGLLIGYIVLRSYNIRVFPRCDFPMVPWSAWHLVRCGVLFLALQRLLFVGMVDLESLNIPWGRLADVPPVIVQVLESNLLMAATCGLVLALIAAGGQKPVAALGLRERFPLRRAALGAVGYVMIFPVFLFAAFLTALFAKAFEVPMQQQPVVVEARSLSSLGYLVFGFSAVVLAPMTEEFLFRGFLYGTLRRYLGPMAAICVSAAAFATAHAFAFGFLPLFVIGFLLAYLYERTGSLVAPMAAHAAHNFYILAVLRVLQSPGFL